MSRVQTVVRSGLRRFRAVPLEAVFWTAGLVFVASIEPQASDGLNLCLFENLGLPCPGDGLGRSIAHLVRGEWAASWNAHPLAVPVVGVLVWRVVTLCQTSAPTGSKRSLGTK